MATWIKDERGNKNSVEFYGSEEAAKKALDSLEDCDNCTNCSRCSDCSDCSDCSGCSGCSRCSRCSDCSRCSGCSRCSRCSRCSDCSDCSGCSGCSDCSDCSGCSDCAFLYDKKNLAPVESEGNKSIVPVVPVIENIHQKIYEAVTVPPDALDMDSWHSCGTTHCRGGWVVTLAGEEGKKLEAFYNTELAAMMIYAASGYLINPCRFYDKNEEALADMKRLAEEEKAK